MITLNGQSLQTTNIVTSTIQHDSSTPQEMHTLNLARRDGEKLIYTNFAAKEISLTGTIISTDQATFENFLDTFKGNFTVVNGSLVVNYGAGYRLYYVTTEYITLTRSSYNNVHVPFEIKFKVLDPPFGLDCDINGVPIYTNAYSKTTLADIESTAVSLLGSASPKPKIKFTFDVAGDASGFDLSNQTTGKQVTVAPTIVTGDVFSIDTDALKVTQNGEEINFTGTVPDFNIGTNNLVFDIYSSTGTTLEASQTTNNSKKPFWGSRKLAQSFTFSATSSIPKLSLILSKVGAPTGDITLTIQTDSAGAPSGTVVTNGTATITAAEISTNALWIQKIFDLMPSISTGSTYWLVLATTGGDVNNFYQWHYNNTGGYANGSADVYVASWAAIASSDFCFKIYKTTVDQSNASIADDTITDSFTTTTNKDAGNTTADWNTTLGKIKFPLGTEALDRSRGTRASNSDFDFGTVGGISQPWFGMQVLQGGELNKIILKLKKTGTPSDAVSVDVYRCLLSGGRYVPNIADIDRIGSCTATIAGSTITTSYADYTFNIDECKISANDHIAVVLSRTGANNSSNYYSMPIYFDSFDGTEFSYINYDQGIAESLVNMTAYYSEYYKQYTSTSNTAQSLAVDSILSTIISATLSATQTLPATTSIANTLSADGTNFESVTLGAEHVFTNKGSALKFKQVLSGSSVLSPDTKDVTIAYKAATLLNATTNWTCQSFVPTYTAQLSRLVLNVAKVGTPTDLVVKIYSDSAGSPNTLLATQNIAASEIETSFGWIPVTFSSPASLTASSTYWIVISGTGVDASNYFMVRTRTGNLYAGALKVSTNSGGAYTTYTNEDIMFVTYRGTANIPQVTLSVDYIKRFI